jgi:hypothetical protein
LQGGRIGIQPKRIAAAVATRTDNFTRDPRRLAMAPTAKSATAVNWDGSPLTLAQYEQAQMAQTPNGSVIFIWQNVATMNQDGTLVLTSGGSEPQTLAAPALNPRPSFEVRNWQAMNLNVTNLSVMPNTPILIAMLGPGLGATPANLVVGTPLMLAAGQTAQGLASGDALRLTIRTDAKIPATIGLTVGPSAGGSHTYLLGLNMPSKPPGYTQTSPDNGLIYGPFESRSGTAFVANISAPGRSVSVLLQASGC